MKPNVLLLALFMCMPFLTLAQHNQAGQTPYAGMQNRVIKSLSDSDINELRRGGVSALTVAFLIPVFGTVWGAWLLGESVTWATMVGGLLVLLGTALVMGFSLRALFGRSKQQKGQA